MGKISAKQVQEYAFGADQQGAVGMGAAAKAGTSGKHAQNIHRSLLSIFGKPQGAPDITWCEVPTKRGNVLHPFMLPHKWFASLFAHRPDVFASSVKGPEKGCAAFWTMMAPTE